MKAIGAKALSEIGDLYKSYDVIAVDEGQFFPDVSLLLNNLHRIALLPLRHHQPPIDITT